MHGRVIAIGSSAHGIEALQQLVRQLPGNLPAAVLVVQHTAPDGPGFLPWILSRAGSLPAAHAQDGEAIEPGRIYVAPPDRHLLVREGGKLHLSHGPKENRSRPAVDATFRSLALACGAAAVGVVLTGYLDDGTAGLLTIKAQGGLAVVQDPHEALAPSMPASALRHVEVDHCCSLAAMGSLLTELAQDPPPPAPMPADPSLARFEALLAAGRFGVGEKPWLDQLASPSGLNCPDCRSALYELKEGRFMRFRCRCGHGFSARTLLSEQALVRENFMASLFGSLAEEAALARRLSKDEGSAQTSPLAQAWMARADFLDVCAAQVAQWMNQVTPPG